MSKKLVNLFLTLSVVLALTTPMSAKASEATVNDISYDSVTEEQVDFNLRGYNYVPASVKELLAKNGWTITLTTKSLDEAANLGSFYKKAIGVANNNTKEIFVKAVSNTNTTIIHEMGHAWDHEMGNLSKSKEFKALYKEEKSAFLKAYGFEENSYDVNTRVEYFATAFKYFCLYDESFDKCLKNSCPKTYAYFEGLLN